MGRAQHRNALHSQPLLKFCLLSVLIGILQAANPPWHDTPFEVPSELEGEPVRLDINEITKKAVLHIDENWQTSGALIILKFTEPTDEVVVELSSDENNNYNFTLENDEDKGWILMMNSDFDYEKIPGEFRVIFTANWQSSQVRQNFYIQIVDVNDNKPEIIGREPSRIDPIEELKEPNETAIVRIIAEDEDANEELKFTLTEDGEASVYFEIKEDTGEVFQIKELNYAEQSSHRLDIKVTETRDPFNFAEDAVTISVIDIPNLPPVFSRTPIIPSLREDMNVDDLVGVPVSARDGDTQLNWEIKYSIEDEFDFLQINATSGEITIKNKMDAESEALQAKDLSYEVTIFAREIPGKGYDKPEMEANETVHVTILDVDDEWPQFCEETDPPETGSTTLGTVEECKAEKRFSFQIYENHGAVAIPMDNDDIIGVIDYDYTTRFNTYDVDFAPGTDEWIMKAFTISPRQGSGKETFTLSVADVEAIDFDNETKHWRDDDGNSEPVEFKIEFIGTINKTQKAIATFEATVLDVNDNGPIFKLPDGQDEYEFSVCENTEDGERLYHILPHEDYPPNSCRESSKDVEIKVFAEDIDISKEFGQDTVIYQWSKTARLPPITIDKELGTMRMEIENENGFDFERRQEEFFMLEALDSYGEPGALSSSVFVRFKILDVNDMDVDLKFGDAIRASINESAGWNLNVTSDRMLLDGLVLDNIIATDDDLTANIVLTMDLVGFNGDEEVRSNVEKWFVLDVWEGSGTGSVKARIMLGGELLPDREGYGIMDIDRVDLRIEAEDLHSETGRRQVTSQDVTIIIEDINDNVPEWPSEQEDHSGKTFEVQETDDNETSTNLDIQRFRVIDRDTRTVFSFSLENQLEEDDEPDCQLSDEICRYIREDMFELAAQNTISGTTVVSRRQGVPIDRENMTLFPADIGEDRIIKLTFVASDGTFSLKSKFNIRVTDINDNSPIFEGSYLEEYFIHENVIPTDPGWEIVDVNATDADDSRGKFGKVSYIIEQYLEAGGKDGYGNFSIDQQNGSFTAAVLNTFDWYEVQQYQVKVKAVDDYKEENPGQSNFAVLIINVTIIDTNTYPPEFLTKEEEDLPLITIGETAVEPNVPFGQTIRMRDRDDPSKENGKFFVEIESVERKEGDPIDVNELFRLSVPENGSDEGNIKEVGIIPTKNFTGLWGTYTLKLQAYDGPDSEPDQLTSENTYTIKVVNENLNPPEFIVPKFDNITYRLSINDAKPREQLVDKTENKAVPNVYAIDKDDGSGPNGQVKYSLEPSEDSPIVCDGLFDILDEEGATNTTGKIVLTDYLTEDKHKNVECTLIIKASDKGDDPQITNTSLKFYLSWHMNTPPEFTGATITIQMQENQTAGMPVEEVIHAIDADIDSENQEFPDDQIYYYFKGGDYDYFNLDWVDRVENDKPLRIPILSPNKTLDYETKTLFKVVLYATNIPDEAVEDVENPEDVEKQPNREQWLVVTIEVVDVVDTAPTFNAELITAGFSEKSIVNAPIRVIPIIDPDLNDSLSIVISSDIVASDPSLPPTTTTPFELHYLDYPNDRSVDIILKFEPKRTYNGYYTFNITATDSEGMEAEVECRMYMVRGDNVVTFSFTNDMNDIEQRRPKLGEILTDGFDNRCNIDRVVPYDVVGSRQSRITRVETHFVNLINDEPMLASAILSKAYVPDVMNPLVKSLTDNNFLLTLSDGITGPEQPTSDNDPKDIIMYVLIGGVAILVVTLSILGATCFYNNRSLSRRVRALTATTFGSQQSDLNRIGNINAPNTNSYAVEGSNPVWTVDADARRPHEFDTESIGSGGSVLIGAEDEDYFQKSSSNPVFQAEDIVANYDSDGDTKSHYYSEPYGVSSHGKGPAPQPPPFAAKTSKNPLMNLGGGSRKSIDVDAIMEDAYEEDVGDDDDGQFAFGKNDNFAMF